MHSLTGAAKLTGGTGSSVCTHLHSPEKRSEQAMQVETPVWVDQGCAGRVVASLEQTRSQVFESCFCFTNVSYSKL